MTVTTEQYDDIRAMIADSESLTDGQIAELMVIADEITVRIPAHLDAQRCEALSAAYRVALLRADFDTDDPVTLLATKLRQAREAQAAAYAGLQQAALMLVRPAGTETQEGFAHRAGVDPNTVRKWLGK